MKTYYLLLPVTSLCSNVCLTWNTEWWKALLAVIQCFLSTDSRSDRLGDVSDWPQVLSCRCQQSNGLRQWAESLQHQLNCVWTQHVDTDLYPFPGHPHTQVTRLLITLGAFIAPLTGYLGTPWIDVHININWRSSVLGKNSFLGFHTFHFIFFFLLQCFSFFWDKGPWI